MGTFSKYSHRELDFKGIQSITETLHVNKTEVKENIYSHFAFTFEHFTPWFQKVVFHFARLSRKGSTLFHSPYQHYEN